MGTRVPAILAQLVSVANTAKPSDCEVVNGWQAATEFGKIITIGLPDMSVQQFGGYSQPAATVERSDPLGWGNSDQAEIVKVLCMLEVPAGASDSTPASVQAEAGAVIDALCAALTEPDAVPDSTRAWLVESAWFQADLAAGWGVVVQFAIHVESYV